VEFSVVNKQEEVHITKQNEFSYLTISFYVNPLLIAKGITTL
jgi:hypothetical protein